MSKIVAVVTTGGTIGAVLDGRSLDVDGSASQLRHELARIAHERSIEVRTYSAFEKLSEDIRPGDWSILAHQIEEITELGISRILVTHGTDTLAYTATSLALMFGDKRVHSGEGVKLCLTGSFYPIGNKNSDAALNLMAGFEAVLSDILDPGVYVAFRGATSKKAAIIPAFAVKPMYFDEFNFGAVYGRLSANFSEKQGIDTIKRKPRPLRYPSLSNSSVPLPEALNEAASRIFLLNIYPGMNFQYLENCLTNYEAAVLGLYHSGTGPSYDGEGSLLNMIARLKQQTSIFMAAFPSDLIETPYSSTLKLIQGGANVYADIQPHQLFIILSTGVAQGRSLGELSSMLEGWRYGSQN